MIFKSFLKFLFSIILISAIVITTYLLVQKYLDFKNLELKNIAVDNCLKISQYTFNDQSKGIATNEPILKNYVLCMKEKGYATEVKGI